MRNDEMLIGGLLIEVIRKKNLKNLYVRVNPPEGNVTVSTPMELSNEDIKLFVLKKLPEITKVRDRMLSQERQSKREYVSGESHYLWGKPYRLQVVYEGTQHKIVKSPTKIIMTVPEGTDADARERLDQSTACQKTDEMPRICGDTRTGASAGKKSHSQIPCAC